MSCDDSSANGKESKEHADWIRAERTGHTAEVSPLPFILSTEQCKVTSHGDTPQPPAQRWDAGDLARQAIIAEAESSTNLAWLRRTLVEVAGEPQKRVVWESNHNAPEALGRTPFPFTHLGPEEEEAGQG